MRRLAGLLATAALLAIGVTAASEPTRAAPVPFDPEHTRFSFQLRTRWGQKVEGHFPRYSGEFSRLPDGRHRVRIALDANAIRMAQRRYEGIARGPRFFDAANWPTIEFLSEPHAPELLRSGGRLRGTLWLRGRRHLESFELEPATCERPGLDCDIVGRGLISRAHYGMDGWSLALGDRVRLELRVRMKPEAAP